MDNIDERIGALEQGQSDMKAAIAHNTDITCELKEQMDTTLAKAQEIFELINALKGGLKTAAWVGGFIRWIALLVAAIAGCYYTFKGK